MSHDTSAMLPVTAEVRARAAQLLGSTDAELALWRAHCLAPPRYVYELGNALRAAEAVAPTTSEPCRVPGCSGSLRITSIEQRRKADEGATVFLTCTHCRKIVRVNT